MMYRNERVFTKRDISRLGDNIDEVAMRDFCDSFSNAMAKENRIEMTSSPLEMFPDEKLYRAQVHVYHPNEISKIKDELFQLYSLPPEAIEYKNVKDRVREIAILLGFAENKTQ